MQEHMPRALCMVGGQAGGGVSAARGDWYAFCWVSCCRPSVRAHLSPPSWPPIMPVPPGQGGFAWPNREVAAVVLGFVQEHAHGELLYPVHRLPVNRVKVMYRPATTSTNSTPCKQSRAERMTTKSRLLETTVIIISLFKQLMTSSVRTTPINNTS